MVELSVEKRMKQVRESLQYQSIIWRRIWTRIIISVETGVGGCDSIAACMDVQSTWRHYGYRSISGGV